MASSLWERAAQAFEQPKRLDLRALAEILDPKSVTTPAMELIYAALVELVETPDGRLLVSLAPQEGKSQACSKVLPTALLRHRPDTRIVMASYGHDLARRNARAVRDAIVTHPELGMKIRADLSAQNEWELAGHKGGVFAAGIGTSLTGRPADFLIIDDPVKDREEADSEVMRERAWNWWTDTSSARLAPGAPVLVIQTRWHDDDLSGRMLAAEDGHLWKTLNIPALADHDPNNGESDPLGREPGEWLVSTRGRTPAQWEAIRTRVGSRTWESLYQGRPTPASGGMFRRDWWVRYDYPLWITYDNGVHYVPGDDVDMCLSWDLTFKDTSTSDFVVGQVWLRRGAHMFLLDQIRARLNFPDTCAAILAMSAKWPQAAAKYVEDKANGPAVIAALSRTVSGLIPIQPEGSKAARAAAVSPYAEAGNIWLPTEELAPWVDGLIEESASFPLGRHDDQVDAMSQAINRMLLSPWADGAVFVPEEFADWDDQGHISLY